MKEHLQIFVPLRNSTINEEAHNCCYAELLDEILAFKNQPALGAETTMNINAFKFLENGYPKTAGA